MIANAQSARPSTRIAQRIVHNPWVALSVIFLIGVCATADRYILSILAPHVQRDLDLNDAQLGLLIGPAIGILYAIVGIPIGHLADKVNRVRLLAACLSLWSLFTAFGGIAANAWQLALSRIGVSAAEGGYGANSMSLLADYFSATKRALVAGLYSCSSSVGMFLSFSMGGFIAQTYGWRAALFALGIPGILLAILTITLLREPVRGGLDEASVPKVQGLSLWKNLRFFFGIPVYRRALLGVVFVQIASSIIIAWGPTFLLRKFGVSLSAVGFNLGIGLALFGAVCTLIAGWIINRIGPRRFARSLRLVALAQLSGVPFFLLALLTSNMSWAIVGLSLLFGVTHLYLPTQFLVVQNYVPASMRATAAATGSLVVVLIVHGLIPPAVGALSDLLRPVFADESLGLAMLIVIPALILSGVQYLRAARVVDVKSEPAAT